MEKIVSIKHKTIGSSNPPYRAEVLAAYNYYPFGMLQPGMYAEGDTTYRFGFNGMLRDDDVMDKLSTGPDEGRGNSYSTQFRQYDPRVTRWFSNDPLRTQFPWQSPYTAYDNNPVLLIDPFGSSTITSQDGTVEAVYDDKDLSVYRKDDDNLYGPVIPGNGLTEMGETEYWDEFKSPETGDVLKGYKIQFGKSFDPLINQLHNKAKEMDLVEIASASKPGELFDIKNDYPNIGGLLNGKYATSRSAGNFLAGYNAEAGTYLGVGISFKTFQQLAGALHIEDQNNKTLSKNQMLSIVLFGTYKSSDINKFKPPTWGELIYQFRMSKAGWKFGEKK